MQENVHLEALGREVMMDELREVIPDNGRQAAAMIQTFSAQYSTCLQKWMDNNCFQRAPASP